MSKTSQKSGRENPQRNGDAANSTPAGQQEVNFSQTPDPASVQSAASSTKKKDHKVARGTLSRTKADQDRGEAANNSDQDKQGAKKQLPPDAKNEEPMKSEKDDQARLTQTMTDDPAKQFATDPDQAVNASSKTLKSSTFDKKSDQSNEEDSKEKQSRRLKRLKRVTLTFEI